MLLRILSHFLYWILSTQSVSLVVTGFGSLADYHKVFLNKIDSTNHHFAEIAILIESKSSYHYDSLVHEFEEWAPLASVGAMHLVWIFALLRSQQATS